MPAAEPRQRRNQERRANIARRSSRLLAQSLRSEDFTRMISEKQKTLTAAKPQGSQPITPEPAPSPRLWASAWARPLADAITLTRTRKYHASKGTFLPCWKRGHFHFALTCVTVPWKILIFLDILPDNPRRVRMRGFRIVVCLSLISVALSAADSPFAGTWKLNTAKSKSVPGTEVKELTMSFQAMGDQWKRVATGIDADGKPVDENSTISWDGKDHRIDQPGITVAVNQVNDRTLNVKVKREGKVVNSVYVVVSDDGKTLTAHEKGQDPKGRMLDNTGVFERQ